MRQQPIMIEMRPVCVREVKSEVKEESCRSGHQCQRDPEITSANMVPASLWGSLRICPLSLSLSFSGQLCREAERIVQCSDEEPKDGTRALIDSASHAT